MPDNDFYEARFIWPHTEPNTVIVTGTFDDWSASTPLLRTPSGFEGTTRLPWDQKIKYKFIVDGQWTTHEDQPTETDPGGFVNNVFTTPQKPAEPKPAPTAVAPTTVDSVALETPVKETIEPITNGHAANGYTVATQAAKGKPADQQAEVSPARHNKGEDSISTAFTIAPKNLAGYPRLLADLADTIAARDGTSSTLEYVASGIGAAVHSVVGMDPINTQKIPIPTPKPDDAFTLPSGQESAPNSADLSAPTTSGSDPLSPVLALIAPTTITAVSDPQMDSQTTSSQPVVNENAGLSKEPEASTHVPALTGSEPKAEDTATQAPHEVGKKEIFAPEPVFTTLVEKSTPRAQEERHTVESSAIEPQTEEIASPKQAEFSEAPVGEEEKERLQVQGPVGTTVKPEPSDIPSVEEVARIKPQEQAEEEKTVDVNTAAEKPSEPFVQDPARVSAVATEILQAKAEESAKDDSTKVPTAQGPFTEVKSGEADLAIAVPPPKEVAIVKPAPVVQPPFDVDKSRTEVMKEERTPPVVNEGSEGAPVFTQAEEATSEPAIQKEAGQSKAQTFAEQKTDIETGPQVKGRTLVAEPENVTAPLEDKPGSKEAPATPAKNDQTFPSNSESTPDTGSQSSSQFNSTRKKRTSIFGKLKNIFHHEKER